MKKTILTTALLTAFGVAAIVSQSAMAALPSPVSNPGPDGTINITGNVIAQSCLVDGNAAGTSDTKTVTLSNVLTSDFGSSIGSVAAPTQFSIAITGCNAALSTVQAFFTGGDIDTTSGNLLNKAASGSNVEVQLLNASGTAISLKGANATAQNSQSANLVNGAATLNYTAQYITSVTGVPTAGGVTTAVNFTLIYQ